jgi:hypothetical protein
VWAAGRSWLAIDAYGVDCEIVKIVGVTDGGVDVSPAIRRAHHINARVVVLERPEVTPQLFGATADGTGLNDTAAIQAAMNAPVGLVLFPAGHYVVRSPITITSAKILRGVGTGGAGVVTPTPRSNGAIIDSDFPGSRGDLFTITGVPGVVEQGTGGGFENLTIRQAFGSGTGAQGTAIRYVAQSSGFWGSWNRLRDLTIEVVAGKDDWSYGIRLDGTQTAGATKGEGQRDTWIENARIYSGPHAKSGILVETAANLYVLNTLLNGPNAKLTITGPLTPVNKPSAQIRLEGVCGTVLELDNVNQVMDRGGIYQTITSTANTNQVDLQVASLTQTPIFEARNSTLFVGVFTPTGKPTLWAGSGEELRIPSLGFRYGAAVAFGTLDDNVVRLMTNGTERVRVDTTGDLLVKDGDLVLGAAGKGLKIKEGVNGTMGVVTLANGTATVKSTRVSAETRIFLTVESPGGKVGTPYVSQRVAGQSFSIKSTSVGDASTVGWLLIDGD